MSFSYNFGPRRRHLPSTDHILPLLQWNDFFIQNWIDKNTNMPTLLVVADRDAMDTAAPVSAILALRAFMRGLQEDERVTRLLRHAIEVENAKCPDEKCNSDVTELAEPHYVYFIPGKTENLPFVYFTDFDIHQIIHHSKDVSLSENLTSALQDFYASVVHPFFQIQAKTMTLFFRIKQAAKLDRKREVQYTTTITALPIDVEDHANNCYIAPDAKTIRMKRFMFFEMIPRPTGHTRRVVHYRDPNAPSDLTTERAIQLGVPFDVVEEDIQLLMCAWVRLTYEEEKEFEALYPALETDKTLWASLLNNSIVENS